MRPIANRASALIRPRPKTLTRAQVQATERSTIQAAQRAGNLHHYYWYVKMKVPPRYWQDVADDGDDRVACWPGNQFPVFPVAEDVDGLWIEILVESFKAANPGVDFYPALTTTALLGKTAPGRWYVWNELIVDRICERCGQVYRISATQSVECGCEAHRSDADLRRVGLCRVTRAYVDGVTWERNHLGWSMINRLTDYRGAEYHAELRKILDSDEGKAMIQEANTVKATTGMLTQFDLCVITLNHNLPFKAVVEWLEESKVVPSGVYDRLLARGFKVREALKKANERRQTA